MTFINKKALNVSTQAEHKQNAHNDGNRAQPRKLLLETLFLAIKKCIGFIHVIASGLNITFLSQDRSPVRSDVASDRVNFSPDIRQNFFLKK